MARTAPIVDAAKLADLKAKAHEVRRLIIEAINYAKAGHLGGPLSVRDRATSTARIAPDE